MSPRVVAVLNVKNRGAGIPDCGPFTPDQLLRKTAEKALLAQLPARGVVEAKVSRKPTNASKGRNARNEIL